MSIMAEIKGKLSESSNNFERMEDLLTSNIFQLLRYIPPELGILPILQQATNLEESPLPIPKNILDWEIIFWPVYKNCEPDIEIKAYSDNSKCIAHYFVEAKYLSLKSGIAEFDENDVYVAGSDQLERQWNIIQQITKIGENIGLIYLTAHQIKPKKEIEKSIDATSNPYQARISLYWLSWQKIRQELIKIIKDSSINPYHHKVLQDIIVLLEKKGLKDFSGWRDIQHNCLSRKNINFFINWSVVGLWKNIKDTKKIKWRFIK